MKSALGDPSKGWQDVAYNAGTWLIPYGKGAKAINKAVKGTKYVKTAKTVRGVAKTAGAVAAPAALSAALDATKRKKSSTSTRKK